MDKKECLKLLAQNLDLEALRIIAEKSKKPGMSAKIKQYKGLM